jgi:plasmid stability protein
MKATLEYNLPEDTQEHLRAVQANHAWSALYDIDNMLRNLLKHGDDRYKNVEELATAIRIEVRYALDKIDE